MDFHCPLRWLSGSLFLSLVAILPTQAQIVRDTTLPNPSVVTPKGNIDVITGGTQKGTNLFHSFQQFSIPTSKAASFQHNSEINNIISRVTGASASNIDGLLEALENSGNLSSANFFLINPNGILFGQDASLNIGGSFVTSTASSIKFTDGSEFSATNPNFPLPLLSVNVPLGLQFASNPGPIVSKAKGFDTDDFVTSLAVKPRRTLALVGGKIDLVGGALGTRDGRIELGSIAGPGFVSLTPTATGFALGYEGIQDFQDIGLSQSALVDVSGDTGGDVTITAKKLQAQDGSQIASISFGKGRGGTLRVNATDAIELTGIVDGFSSGLTSDVTEEGEGVGGNLVISTRQLTIQNGAQISSNIRGLGRGGDLTVNAEDIELSGTAGDTVSGLFATTGGKGDAGNLKITTQRLVVEQGAGVSTVTSGAGQGGNLTVTASDSLTALGTSLSDSKISDIEKSDVENIENSGLFAQTFSTGSAGRLKITTGQLRVLDGAQIGTTTFTDGRAGDMLVRASTIELAGIALSADGQAILETDGQAILETRDLRPIGSGLFASADKKSTGRGANLTVEAQQLSLRDGAAVQTSTLGSGDAGNLNVTASDIEVIGTAKGGRYPTTIQALSGGLPESGRGVREATGKGGNLRINAGRLLVQDGAAVAVGSLNKTNEARGAGNLNVQAQSIYLNNRGELTAATASGDGGNIRLQAQDVLLLSNNSNISTNAGIAGTIGQGGNITVIDTGNLVALENSDITANATKDRGGEVNITAEGVFGTAAREQQTPASDITASSDLGPQFSGTVQINTPDVDPSEGLTNLPTQPVNTEIAQDCQAGGGKTASRFINSGSGGLPTNPYEPLDSSDILAEVQLPSQWADAENTGTLPRQQMPLYHTSASTKATQSSQIIEAQGWSVNDKGEVSLVAAVPSALSQRGCRLR